MITFNDYISEGTLQDYKAKGFGNPGPRARYHIGDYVVIGGDDRWRSYQSQRSAYYVGHYGKVVGYKQVPGSYVKYAVEFPDSKNDVEAFHSHYLIGPFADETAAKKYTNLKLKDGRHAPTIDPKDVKGSTGGKLQANTNFELAMKNVLTSSPFNLNWVGDGKQHQFISKNNKYVLTVLAVLPLKNSQFKNVPIQNEKYRYGSEKVADQAQAFLDKHVCFYRLNNAINGKFVTETSHKPVIGNVTTSPYFISFPYIDLKNMKWSSDFDPDFFDKKAFLSQIKEIAQITSMSLPLSITKNISALIHEHNRAYEISIGEYDSEEYFNRYYDVQIINKQKTIDGRVQASPKTLPGFMDYVIDGELKIVAEDISNLQIPPGAPRLVFLSTSKNPKNRGNKGVSFPVVPNLKNIPSTVKEIEFNYYDFQSLEGLPQVMDELEFNVCKFQTLKGLPKKLNHLTIHSKYISNFQGGENTVVKGQFNFYNSDKITSLKGIPKAGHYHTPHNIKEQDIKKEIKDREFIKKLDKETGEAWGDVLSGL
jgi:hypothetical protein